MTVPIIFDADLTDWMVESMKYFIVMVMYLDETAIDLKDLFDENTKFRTENVILPEHEKIPTKTRFRSQLFQFLMQLWKVYCYPFIKNLVKVYGKWIEHNEPASNQDEFNG